MKQFIKAFSLLSLILTLTACEEVIDLELPTAAPRLVVEGNLDFSPTNPKDTLAVTLSLTTNYYDKEIPKVHNAKVWVKAANGIEYPFVEYKNTGKYISTEVVKDFLNNEYKLYIEYDKDIYEAKDVLVSTPEIIDVVQTREKYAGDFYYVIRTTFKDIVRPEFPLNYYYTNLQRNDTKPSLSVHSNDFSKGKVIEYVYVDEDFKVGDKIKIEFHQISRNYHDYLNLVISSINNGGGPFQSPIAKIKGNVKNLTNPDKVALGFFRVTEKRTVNHTIFEQPNP